MPLKKVQINIRPIFYRSLGSHNNRFGRTHPRSIKIQFKANRTLSNLPDETSIPFIKHYY